MRRDHVVDQAVQIVLKIFRALQCVGVLPQRFGHGRIQHHVRPRDRGGGAGHAELKLISGKGEGGGSVAIRCVLGQLRHHMNADADHFLFLSAIGLVLFDARKDLLQLVTDVHGNDRRRRLARAETMIVGCGGDREAQHILIIVHRLQYRAEEQQELGVFIWRISRLEQVDARVRHDRPVVVLAAAVDTRKGLFMQQADHVVLAGDLLHQLHCQLVVIGGDVGGREDWSKLVLPGSDLVVLCLGHNPQLPQLGVQFGHKGRHTRLDRAEVVVVQLLSLRRQSAEKRAAGIAQIAALFINTAVDEKIFLLGADRRFDTAHILVSEQPQHAHCLAVERFHGAQQRRFLIQRFASVGAEGRRDAEHAVLDEGIRGGIPGGVTAGLEGRAQTAGGKAGGVRLALDQLLARKLHDDPAAVDGRDKAVVLLGGNACHGLEPVGKVGGSLFDRPILHGVGHDIGRLAVKSFAFVDGTLDLLENVPRQARAHDGIIKYHRSEDICYRVHYPVPRSF